jgi:hypothetical protein
MLVHLIKPADAAKKPDAVVALAAVNEKLRGRRFSTAVENAQLTAAERIALANKKLHFLKIASVRAHRK